MARKIYQIAPYPSGQQQGIGVLLPMNKSAHASNPNLNTITGIGQTVSQDYATSGGNGASVFAMSYSTEEQAISNLKNLLGTNKGERYMQPAFGTRIREAVFQPNTTNLEDFLNETITEAIQRWLPYIVLAGIDIIRDVDQYSFAIRINFSVTENGANRVIVVLANEENIQVATEQETDPSFGLQQVGTFGNVFAAGGY